MYTAITGNAALKNINMSTPWGNISFVDGVATGVTEEQKAFFEGNPHYEIRKTKPKKSETASSTAPATAPAEPPSAPVIPPFGAFGGKKGNGKKGKKAEPASSDASASSEPDDLDI